MKVLSTLSLSLLVLTLSCSRDKSEVRPTNNVIEASQSTSKISTSLASLCNTVTFTGANVSVPTTVVYLNPPSGGYSWGYSSAPTGQPIICFGGAGQSGSGGVISIPTEAGKTYCVSAKAKLNACPYMSTISFTTPQSMESDTLCPNSFQTILGQNNETVGESYIDLILQNPPRSIGSTESYIIKYRLAYSNQEWNTYTGVTKSNVIRLGGLDPNTQYEIKIAYSCNSDYFSDVFIGSTLWT